VQELAGHPELLLITWHDNWYSLHTYENYHYMGVLQGYASTTLFRQMCPFNFYGHYQFSWKIGQHSIDYQNNIVTIVEHWKECQGSGCGTSGASYELKEIQFFRQYELTYAGSDLLVCEERTRAFSGISGPGEPVRDLEPPLPGVWQLTDMSAGDILQKCRAIDHEY
jgi:hypothetical protein